MFPKLVFEIPFDEREQFEAEAKGYLSYAKVMEHDGTMFPIIFYDIVRLAQDLRDEISSNRICVADPGMVVLEKVTFENMTRAVQQLSKERYFDRFKAIENGQQLP